MSHKKDGEETLYYIKIAGNLDSKWADWFEGFTLASCDDHVTLLSGKVADQAALHGILSKINNLGLSLILVIRVDYPHADAYCPMHGKNVPCSIQGKKM